MMNKPPSATMITSAPKAKGVWHFSGDGVFKNRSIEAETIGEARKIWLATREPVSLPNAKVAVVAAPEERQEEIIKDKS